jgi:acetyl esterase/lipase
MIRRFADRAAASGEVVVLDVWDDMTHDFQARGDLLAVSRSALAGNVTGVKMGLALDGQWLSFQ